MRMKICYNTRVQTKRVRHMEKTKIKVFGIGSGGCRIVDILIVEEAVDAEFFTVDTEMSPHSLCKNHICVYDESLAKDGVEMNELYGSTATEHCSDKLIEAISDTDLLFIAAGIGDSAEYGMAAALSKIARQSGIPTVAVIATPFNFEGEERIKESRLWIDKIKENSDGIVLISSEKILSDTEKDKTYARAMKKSDMTLAECINDMSSYITVPKTINYELFDLMQLLSAKGQIYYGKGEGKGKEKIFYALQRALDNRIQDVSPNGAKNIVLSVEGGCNLGIHDCEQVIQSVRDIFGAHANIVFGANIDMSLSDTVRVTVFASDMNTGGED